jgi:hypothetical protein
MKTRSAPPTQELRMCERIEVSVVESITYVYTIRAVYSDLERRRPQVLQSGRLEAKEQAAGRALSVAKTLSAAYVNQGKGPATVVEVGTALDVKG